MNPKQYITAILAHGIKQRELAELVPCSSSIISSISCGERGKNTAYWIVERFAEILRQLEISSKLPKVKI